MWSREAAQRAAQDTEARQVIVTMEAKPGERFTHLITVSTPITYPVKQLEAEIAWQANSGLGMTSTGFSGDPPRADSQRRRYTFRASVNPEIRPTRPSGSWTSKPTATTSSATTPNASLRIPNGSRL